MVETAFASRITMAYTRVRVARPEWGGAGVIGCTEWRLESWAGLPPGQAAQVIYLPGAFANFAPHGPTTLLEMAWQRGVPLWVTALDLPEYGPSELPPGWAARMAGASSFVDDATLLNAVLDEIAPGPVWLVGWSTGANLATIMASLAPHRTAGLQLCMPAGFVTQPVLTELVPHFTQTGLSSMADPLFRQLLRERPPLTQGLDLLRSVGKLPAILQMIRLLGQSNAVPFAAQVYCPVAWVLAREDRVFHALLAMHTRSELYSLFGHAPSVTVDILENATHDAFSTHSAEVAAITLDLLTRQRVAAGAGDVAG